MRRLLFILVCVCGLIATSAFVLAAPAAQEPVAYVVQPGDTLYRIAVRFNTTVSVLAQFNNIANPNIIYVGSTLRIPPGGVLPPAPPTAVPAPTTTPGQGTTIYIVARGDYLAAIARRFNVTVTAIQQANGIANPNVIYAGQQLVIPAPGQPPPPPPPTGVPPTGVPPTVPPTTTTYTVQRGDSLARIAARFGVTIQAIAQANGISNPNLIYAGQVLRIPAPGVVPPAPTGVPPTGVPPTGVPPTAGPPPTGVAFELGGQVFGFNSPDAMRTAGMTYAKLQVRWSQGEPASVAQDEINAARSRGFRVLLSVIGDPGQLAANPSQYYNDFANFLGGVAALGPDAIEVWNEMNIDREWPRGSISPASYTQMLAAAFNAIKRANPNVLVISGAPAPTGFFGGQCTGNGCDDDAFIRGMAAAGAANYADCIGIHYNEGILPPTASSGDSRGNPNHYTRYYPTMVNLYASVFPTKQLCFTELGYLSPEGFGPLPPGFEWAVNTSVQEQAQWLSQAVSLARQSGRIRLFIVWNVDSTTYGADPQAGFAIVRNGQCVACNALDGVMP